MDAAVSIKPDSGPFYLACYGFVQVTRFSAFVNLLSVLCYRRIKFDAICMQVMTEI